MKNDFLRDYLKDSKEVIIPAEQENETAEFTDESADKVMNIIGSMTREIYNHINSISCYVGIPCRVSDINEQAEPATVSGGKQVCDGYIGYTVDLKRYRKHFGTVRFCAAAPVMGNAGIVRGIVIDDEGKVESIAAGSSKENHEWTRLPITPKSSLLVATLPIDKEGNPEFVPEYVEMLPDGIVQSISEYMGDIVKCCCDISDRVRKLEQQFGDMACCGCPVKE